MGKHIPTATVKVTSKEHCIELQAKGWAIGCGDAGAFGWKRSHEVTEEDRATFNIDEEG